MAIIQSFLYVFNVVFYALFSYYILKNNKKFNEYFVEFHSLHQNYPTILKKQFNIVFFYNSLYNIYIKEILNFIGFSDNIFLYVIFIFSQLYLCKYDNIKHTILYFFYLLNLSLFVINKNHLLSFSMYFSSNMIVYTIYNNLYLNKISKILVKK